MKEVLDSFRNKLVINVNGLNKNGYLKINKSSSFTLVIRVSESQF